MHLRHPIQWDSPEYPPRPVCTFRTAHRVYQNDGRMLPQNGQLDNPLFEIFYRKVCGDALHHEEVPETTRCAGICRGSTAAFRLCNGAKFVYNEENEKLAPRIGRQRSRKRPARAERRRGGKARREQNASVAGKQGESRTPARQESKARAECRRGGGAGKDPRGRNVGAAKKQGEDGMPVRRKSKPQVGCRDAGKQTAGGMRRRGKARRGRNVGAAGKQGEGGTSARQESKARAERRCGGKANRRRDAETRERESGNTVK